VARTSRTLAVALAYYFAAQPTRWTAPAGSDEHVIYLDQAWSREDGDTFYRISQGTSMMSLRHPEGSAYRTTGSSTDRSHPPSKPDFLSRPFIGD
jgi:hypothetical protein